MPIPDLTLRRAVWRAITEPSPGLSFGTLRDAILVITNEERTVSFGLQERPGQHEIEEIIAWLRLVQAEVGT